MKFKHRRSILLVLLFTGLFLWMFWRALFGGEGFAFRDGAHFYGPIFRAIQQQWGAGRIPLWDPYENLGMPLLGSGTASVFYPGKLLYILPLSPHFAYILYVTGHVLLAGWTAYRLARHWRIRSEAAALAAVAYAFSGSVLYQYGNVIYLIGAAWLPLAIAYADRLAVARKARAAVGLGVVLALMILGGDPQTAYHAGMLAAWLALWRCVETRSSKPQPEAGATRTERWGRRLFQSRLALLALAAATAVLLSAVQVLPLQEFSNHSERSLEGPPRDVYGWAAAFFGPKPSENDADQTAKDRSAWDALLCRNLRHSIHLRFSYDFSVGPWRLAELLWPNVGGRQFPVHSRWFEVFPAEARVWVPTLYLGVIPLLLALSAMRLRPRRDATSSWLTYVTLFGLLAALGGFGPVWLARELATASGLPFPRPEALGGPVGGVYWLLNCLAPLYSGFRYPAKWMTVASLGLAMLAAIGFDRRLGDETKEFRITRLAIAAAAVSLVSLIAAGCLGMCRHGWLQWAGRVPADPMFGPYDAAAAWRIVLFGLVQTGLVTAFFVAWLMYARKLPALGAALLLLGVVVIDLAVANGWTVATAPRSCWEGAVPIAEAVLADANRSQPSDLRMLQAENSQCPPPRIYRHPVWYPEAWRTTTSENRLAESVLWDRTSLWPRYNRAEGIAVAEVHGTMTPGDYYIFLGCLRARGPARASHLDIMGAAQAILPGRPSATVNDLQPVAFEPLPEDVTLWRNPSTPPRAWIVHRADVLPSLESRSVDRLARRTYEVFWPPGRSRDLEAEAVVEVDPELLGPESKELIEALQGTEEGREGDGERCGVVDFTPNRVDLHAVLRRPGMVVLAEQFFPGWRAQVTRIEPDGAAAPVPVEILRTNRFMRGLLLPAGEYEIRYTYRPRSFVVGGIVSAAAWLVLLVSAFGLRRRASREREAKGKISRTRYADSSLRSE